MKKGEKAGGFTILEVALVIAIAGAIFLLMLIALPALRASQRDSVRREDVIQLVNEVKQYQKDNRGTLPGAADDLSDGRMVQVTWDEEIESSGSNTWAGFYRDYMKESFMDPSGEHYGLTIRRCDVNIVGNDCGLAPINNPFPNNYNIVIATSAVCNGGTAVQTNNPRKVAAMYVLESGGVFCINS